MLFTLLTKIIRWHGRARTYSNITNVTSALVLHKPGLGKPSWPFPPSIGRDLSSGGMESSVLSTDLRENDFGNQATVDKESKELDSHQSGPAAAMTTSPCSTISAHLIADKDKIELDKYSYLAKGYTTEVYKIELKNLPARLGYKVTRFV